ncbi:hypothetical protein [Flavobacterium selenitireducens]|uniref:hypothetical protein n=1 Tax=Flavobacterium selenitireducens TaxID=2722704 RepID=UPI00168A91E0|nr:hypothetical protein [Flavobacterium selenitireducens]MBD3581992.1 hypothetical protein [Flavobacterium selenitireducens]
MKHLITTALLLVSAVMAAQHLKVSGTHFGQGVDSKKWSNTTSQEKTSATFKSFTGETYVAFVSDKDLDLKLDYELRLSEGEADVVFSGNGTEDHLAKLHVDNDGKGKAQRSKTVHLKAGVEYRLVFRGERSKGIFVCNWSESSTIGNE